MNAQKKSIIIGAVVLAIGVNSLLWWHINRENARVIEDAEFNTEMHKLNEAYGGQMPEDMRLRYEMQRHNKRMEDR